ncbi:MAG TPA: hypothetical protein VKR53_09065 [Puia sp.]|nr:hypothetical protein [Puia sp.]
MAKKNKKVETVIKDGTSKKNLKVLGQEFVNWAKFDDALNWKEFFVTQDIAISDVFEWMTDRDFAKHIEIGKYLIGGRREKLALVNKANPSIVLASQPLYDMEYRDYKASLLKDQSNVQKTVKLFVESFQTPEDFPKRGSI